MDAASLDQQPTTPRAAGGINGRTPLLINGGILVVCGVGLCVAGLATATAANLDAILVFFVGGGLCVAALGLVLVRAALRRTSVVGDTLRIPLVVRTRTVDVHTITRVGLLWLESTSKAPSQWLPVATTSDGTALRLSSSGLAPRTMAKTGDPTRRRHRWLFKGFTNPLATTSSDVLARSAAGRYVVQLDEQIRRAQGAHGPLASATGPFVVSGEHRYFYKAYWLPDGSMGRL